MFHLGYVCQEVTLSDETERIERLFSVTSTAQRVSDHNCAQRVARNANPFIIPFFTTTLI